MAKYYKTHWQFRCGCRWFHLFTTVILPAKRWFHFFLDSCFSCSYNGSTYFLEVVFVCARAWFHLFLDTCHSCSYKNMVPPIFHHCLVSGKIMVPPAGQLSFIQPTLLVENRWNHGLQLHIWQQLSRKRWNHVFVHTQKGCEKRWTMFCNYMVDDCPEKGGKILPKKRWNHIFA